MWKQTHFQTQKEFHSLSRNVNVGYTVHFAANSQKGKKRHINNVGEKEKRNEPLFSLIFTCFFPNIIWRTGSLARSSLISKINRTMLQADPSSLLWLGKKKRQKMVPCLTHSIQWDTPVQSWESLNCSTARMQQEKMCS